MTLPTHIMMGLIIGKTTGNYSVAILSSILVDLDHLQYYVSHGLILKPRKLWKALTDQKDPWGDQRGIFHNVIFFGIVAILLVVLGGTIGKIIVLGYLGHLLLDSLDNSDYYPLYPNKKINLKGFINYGTWQELLFFIVLLVVFFVI